MKVAARSAVEPERVIQNERAKFQVGSQSLLSSPSLHTLTLALTFTRTLCSLLYCAVHFKPTNPHSLTACFVAGLFTQSVSYIIVLSGCVVSLSALSHTAESCATTITPYYSPTSKLRTFNLRTSHLVISQPFLTISHPHSARHACVLLLRFERRLVLYLLEPTSATVPALVSSVPSAPCSLLRISRALGLLARLLCLTCLTEGGMRPSL